MCYNSCVCDDSQDSSSVLSFPFGFKLEVALSAQNSTCESLLYLMGCCPAIGSHEIE